MSTVPITRRTVPLATAAAATTAVLAFAGLMLAQNNAGSSPSGTHTDSQAQHHDTWHPTTSGGHIELGTP